MMFKDFYCPECLRIEEKCFESFSDYEKEKESFQCPNCEGVFMKPYFGSSAKIQIPEYMRAITEDSKTYDYAKNLMLRAKRPSGRSKIYY